MGVLSTSGVLEALAEKGRGGPTDTWLQNTLVRELMTSKPQYVAPEDDIKVAAQEMLYRGAHWVFVLSEDRLVVVLPQSDVVEAFASGTL